MYIYNKHSIIVILLEKNMTNNGIANTDREIQDHHAFVNSVKASLDIAKERTAGIRKTDRQLFVANVVSPAGATLLATIAASIGGNAMFVQAATQTEDGGWRLACILVAIFSFIATVSGMFKKQFEDRLTQGNQCVGRLLSLDLAIATGSNNWEAMSREYGEIIKAFPDFVS
jgi:hypothetical protein